jgi:cyclopropane-fatty-acyl-phospholipid synthase
MGTDESTAEQLATALGTVLGVDDLPVRLRAWDGSVAGPPGAPVVTVRDRRALRRLVWSPGQVGLGRAYVVGELDVEDDVVATLAALTTAGWSATTERPQPPTVRQRACLLGTAARLGALGPPPPRPPQEVRARRSGRRHTRTRDAAAISHHYDVGNDFYRLVLGPTLVYSCAVWNSPATGLDAAQEAKLDLVCRKLALRPGARLLDVGCGWGSMALHAAQRYGADVVGVTISAAQAALARERVAAAGLADRVEIRVQDYRDVPDGPFDAISSIGMAEHVGAAGMPVYVATLRDLLRPGGRLLNHAIAQNVGDPRSRHGTFINRFVFPDGELLRLGDTVAALEAGGLEVLDVEALRRHYVLTLRAWLERLEKHWDAAVAASDEGRARVWRLYMAATALAFETGRLGVDQVLARRPGGEEPPLRLRAWL